MQKQNDESLPFGCSCGYLVGSVYCGKDDFCMFKGEYDSCMSVVVNMLKKDFCDSVIDFCNSKIKDIGGVQ